LKQSVEFEHDIYIYIYIYIYITTKEVSLIVLRLL